MRIDEQEHQRVLETIATLTAIDERAPYGSYLRTRFTGDARLERIEKVIDRRAYRLTVIEDGP